MSAKFRINRGKQVAALALSLSVTLGGAPLAYAEPAEEQTQNVQTASEEMTRLNEEAEQSEYDLITVTIKLAETEQLISDLEAQIEQSKGDLDVAKQNLANFIAQDYKSGSVSIVDLLMNAQSFDDLVARIVYANKIAEHQQDAVHEVDRLYTELATQKSEAEQARSDLEGYLEEQLARIEAANQASEAAVSFFEALPADVQQEIETQDMVRRQDASVLSNEILAAISTQTSTGTEGQAAAPTAGTTTAATDTTVTSQAPAVTTTTTTGQTSSGSTSTSSSDLLSRVESLLGSGYQWSGYNWTGSTETSSFTCSGIVDYGLGRSSRSSSPETLYAEVGSNLVTSTDQLNPGDLVFYPYGGRSVGHVGVYVGDGQIIDSIPNGGVQVRDVNYMTFVGGGSLG